MYPAVKSHLLSFGKERLEQTGATRFINGEKIKSRKLTNNKWFETQDSIKYWEDFNKPKIIYSDISRRLSFSADNNEFFLGNTCYFMTFSNESFLPLLLKILNSKLIDWYYRTISVQLGENAVRLFSIYVLKIPIPKDQLELLSTNDDDAIIDKKICELYNLSDEETQYILSQEL